MEQVETLQAAAGRTRALVSDARFEPAAVVDIAALTGACVIALGHIATGLFANDQKLADEIKPVLPRVRHFLKHRKSLGHA